MSSLTPSKTLSWLGALLAVYLAVPLAAFAVRLASASHRGFSNAGLWPAVRTSLEAATISTAIVAAVGIPLAFVLARSAGRIAKVVGAIVVLPLALPPVMAGILLVYLFGPYTTVGKLFGGRLVNSLAGIVAAQVFVSAPFMIVAARSAFASIDPSLDDLAATLGHGRLARFWRVSLPVADRAIRAGLLLTWLRAIGEYGANVVVAYHPFTIPVYTYVQFSGAGIPDTQAPTVLVLAAAGVATAVIASRRPAFLRRRPADPDPATPGRFVATKVEFDIDVRVGSFALRVAHNAGSHRLAILGPSGSGKSMTLKSIAGLLGADAGHVSFEGADVTSKPPEKRNVGYVPQGHGLIPTLTVREQARLGVGTRDDVAAWWLQRLGLGGLEGRYPDQLSGGQRQRVSFAAALAGCPRVVLLDEPFSALDTPVRNELRRELRRLQQETGLSTILVTHDPEEASVLADEVIVLSAGRVLQAGAITEVFRQPASPQVARLVGFDNVLDGVACPPDALKVGNATIPADTAGIASDTAVSWSVRPDDVNVVADGADETGLPGVVIDVVEFATCSHVTVRVEGGSEIVSRAYGTSPPARQGERCIVVIAQGAVRVWPAKPGDRQ